MQKQKKTRPSAHQIGDNLRTKSGHEAATQEQPHPNRLRELLIHAGLTLRETAQEAGVVERTLRRYANGEQVIPRRDRVNLARVIGCEIADLAPQEARKKLRYSLVDERGPALYREFDTHFSFGRIKTTSLVLDGNGEEVYSPENMYMRYDPTPAVFFDEVMEAKKQIEQEQAEKRANGEPYQWNGEKYHLSKIVISREPAHENMVLSLTFKPRDHYTGLATRRCLDDPAFRAKYIPADHDWSEPIVGMSCSMGVDLTVVSSDGYAFLTQRGQHQSVHQGMYHSSVSEAVSPAFDRSTNGPAPDMYRCACRGLSEELGLVESIDFSVSDIRFLSFVADVHYALYGLRGVVRVRKSADDILRTWQAGVKDKMENKKIWPVPFTPEDIAAFVFSHEPWAGGLICLYHSLVHEFGYERTDAALDAY